ncbi:MAG: 50S ribosomal protein L24 [Holosporales bacterium]|jgi:large subunit ribosomal protein L24|nr:50S ribosomal protein L24 [Holosporales bacterium]
MTQPKFKIKKGDVVQVTAGGSRGQRGTVLKVFLDEGKVIVGGVNVVIRNVKPDYKHPDGPYRKEMKIDISNVSLVDPSTNRPAKVGYKIEDGKKVRYFKKSGNVMSGVGR